MKKIRSEIVFLCLALANTMITNCMELAVVEARARYSELIDPIIAEVAHDQDDRLLETDLSIASLTAKAQTVKAQRRKSKDIEYLNFIILDTTVSAIKAIIHRGTITAEEIIRLTVLCDFLSMYRPYIGHAHDLRNVILRCEKSDEEFRADNVFEHGIQKIDPFVGTEQLAILEEIEKALSEDETKHV